MNFGWAFMAAPVVSAIASGQRHGRPRGGGRDAEAVANLRRAFPVLGPFARDNRPFLARVFPDALSGEQCAREFLRENMPRHIAVLGKLIVEGQNQGRLMAVPVAQALGLCGGALVMPILVGGALPENGALARPTAPAVEGPFPTAP